MERLGPVTDDQLLRFMVDCDLMNYFTLQLGLSEMEEQGSVRRVEQPLEPVLEITSAGRALVTEYLPKLPQSRRTQVDAAAQEYRQRFRLQQQTPAELVQLPDGSRCLRLRLLENGRTLLDIWYTLPKGMKLDRVHERWCSVSSAFYCTLTAALMSAPEPVRRTLPESACIQPGRDGEWLLSLSGGPEEEPMVSLLSLPDEATALLCALRWPEQAERMHKVLLEAMRNADV